ncbi:MULTISPECIES: zinc-binding alcohol dehydrogenase family protein [unclassified Sphingomonas]|uniref:zinc-binding alcohol dehydrogenase family protein n=1 Tax=Novosphingobium rhizosphaerae TaxID=1551649 RepID=UPI0015C9BCF4
MKAIVCQKPFELSAANRASPGAGEGEVLVRMRRVGLCGTDYHIFTGNQPFLSYPRVIGHELGGEVVEAPAGSAFRAGQTVTINPYLPCGKCVACRRGKPNCCVNIAVLGVHADGGLCEWIAVPEQAVMDVDGLSFDEAAMIEFLAIGAHAVARAGVTAGDRVLVAGAGPIGVAVALFAQLDGALVTLLDTRAARLDYARDALGFADVLLVDADLNANLAARTNGDFYDVVFDATGSIAAMQRGLDFVAHGGTYALVSVVKDDLVFPDPEFHKRETTLLACRNALKADFERVIAAMRSGAIPVAALHTHSVQMADLPDQMAILIADADRILKAIVEV